MDDCIECESVFVGADNNHRFCSDKCKLAYDAKHTQYNASSIIVKHDVMQDWELIPYLADKYKRDKKWIERGIQACREAGVSERYFIARYLDRDITIALNKNVGFESRKLQREMLNG